MRPEVVADLLSTVEHSWVQLRVSALKGNITDAGASDTMQRSCVKVASAVTHGASGDYDKVSEYMQDVCKEGYSSPADRQFCWEFAKSIRAFMSGDAVFNREELDLPVFCADLYKGAISEAADNQVKAEKAQAEAEAAKREAEAAAKAKRDAEAKAEQEAKAKARREAEAKAKAQREAEAKANREKEAKKAAEAKAKQEEEAKSRQQAKAKQEAEAKAKQAAELEDEAAKAKKEAEAKEEALREAEVEAQAAEAKAVAQTDAKVEAEAKEAHAVIAKEAVAARAEVEAAEEHAKIKSMVASVSPAAPSVTSTTASVLRAPVKGSNVTNSTTAKAKLVVRA